MILSAITKQARWQHRRLQAGLCPCCGLSRGDSKTTRCVDCNARKREASRKRARLSRGIDLDTPLNRSGRWPLDGSRESA